MDHQSAYTRSQAGCRDPFLDGLTSNFSKANRQVLLPQHTCAQQFGCYYQAYSSRQSVELDGKASFPQPLSVGDSFTHSRIYHTCPPATGLGLGPLFSIFIMASLANISYAPTVLLDHPHPYCPPGGRVEQPLFPKRCAHLQINFFCFCHASRFFARPQIVALARRPFHFFDPDLCIRLATRTTQRSPPVPARSRDPHAYPSLPTAHSTQS